MKQLRLLLVTGIYPPDIGGPAIYTSTLMEKLPAHGIETKLVNFSSLLNFPRGIRHLMLLFRILRSSSGTDVIFAQDPVSSGFPALIAAKLLGRPMVLRVGGDFAWEQATELYEMDISMEGFQDGRWGMRIDLLIGLERWVAKNADQVITPSEFLKQLLLSWGVPGERITVVHNGVGFPASLPSRTQARRTVGIDGKLVVSIGRLIHFKGFQQTIRTIADLRTSISDISLVIIGSGPRQVELASLIRTMELEEYVFLTGPLTHDNTMLYLRAADLLVLNSAGEGQSHVILEAMLAGTPVVTTNTGGNPELIEHGSTGWLVGFDDQEALSNAITRLLRDRTLAAGIARSAQQSVLKYSVQAMLDGTIRTLEGVR